MSFRRVGKDVLYEGEKVGLELHHLEDEAGRRITREVCPHPGAVCILPFVDDATILLIRNLRWPIDQTLLELPAGTLGRGEAPLLCAGRELEEETGHVAARVEPIADFFTAPGILGERMWAFAAYDLTPTRMALEPGEEIEVVPTRYDDALALIGRGEIVDGKTITTLLLYDRFHREQRDPARMDRHGVGRP